MLPVAPPTEQANQQVSNLCPVLEPHRATRSAGGSGQRLGQGSLHAQLFSLPVYFVDDAAEDLRHRAGVVVAENLIRAG
jgi:hypothetical protein